MVKRKGSESLKRSKVSDLPDVESEEEDTEINLFDNIDEYERKRDKILLDTNTFQETDEDEEEAVLDIASDEDQISDDLASDIADDETNLPDARAWGKKKSIYYNTDYVDEDFGGFRENELEAAELEEQEARNIQQQLVEQLEEQDFSLDLLLPTQKSKVVEVEKEVVSADLSKLSKRQKLEVLHREAPEFLGLVSDFNEKMKELCDVYHPLLKILKDKNIPSSPATDYVKTKYHLLLNYCTNISFYLLLKVQRTPVQSHPVIKRLFQFRQLLKELEKIDSQMKPDIEIILKMQEDGEDILPKVQSGERSSDSKKKTKMLKLLSKQVENVDNQQEEIMNSESSEGEECDVKSLNVSEKGDQPQSDKEQKEIEVHDDAGDSKRAITYQMAKNKGLLPYRKREVRNPRVRHRNKYRKAKIRRKGQVREFRPEIEKYGGERSGIKIGISKSIKLK